MLSPAPIIELATAYWKSRAFLAALKLDIFAALGSEGQPPAVLSAKLKVPEEKLRILLGTLAELGLVELRQDTGDVAPTPLSAMFLNPASPACMAPALRYAVEMYPLWDNLENALRQGESRAAPPSKKDTPGFLRSMHGRAQMLAPAVLPLLDLKPEDHILDVAAGAGSWSLLLQQRVGIRNLLLLEQPELLGEMRAFITTAGLEKARFADGDYRVWSPSESFDAILYFGALHQEPAAAMPELFARLTSWLKPGGQLYVLDLFYGAGEPNSLFAYLFGLSMMITRSGSVQELAAAVAALRSCPFVGEVREQRVPGDMPYHLLRARRRT